MNIIKLKDNIKIGDSYFNENLKGKYAYWIHMRYIVALKELNTAQYTAVEEDINRLLKKEDGTLPKPYGRPYYDIYKDFDTCDVQDIIDIVETDRINDIKDYIISNECSTSADITIDDVKKFRTWLAKTLLLFDIDADGKQLNEKYSEETTHMLQYYAANMYDDVVKYLTMFSSSTMQAPVKPNCGCCGNSDLSSLYTAGTLICDNVKNYKLAIYNKMVATFSDIDFWRNTNYYFLETFKTYIDNIISTNLPLIPEDYIVQSDFVDCGCHYSSSQDMYKIMLQNLSKSLQYLKDGQVNSHKLFISDALNAWAKNLYESMDW